MRAPCTVAVAACTLLLAPALWADAPGAPEWVEIDAASMCGMLARDLAKQEIRDTVTVTSSTSVEKKTDTFEVFLGAPDAETGARRLDLVLGPLRVHGADGYVRVTHAKHEDTVYEVAIAEGGTLLGTVGDALPPIPMPQVWMALAEDSRVCPPLGPYLGAVNWERGELAVEAKPPRLRLFGTAAETKAAVELHATVEPTARIERIVIRDEAASSTIDIRIEPLGPDVEPPPAVPVDSRRRVERLAELVGATQRGQ